jgi:uncharacterized FlaG/YvyC family protein
MDAMTMHVARRVETTSAPSRSDPRNKPPVKAGQASQEKPPAQPSLEPADLAAAAAELATRLNLKVELGQDDHTGRSVVRIFSHDGERLLRQIPPETTLRMLDRLRSGEGEGLLGLTV